MQHETDAVAEICGEINRDRMTAARKVLAYLRTHADPKPLFDAARLLVFSKGNDAHDYKFSAAVLEDVYRLSPAWRANYLAASVFNLTGSGSPGNALMLQARAVLSSGQQSVARLILRRPRLHALSASPNGPALHMRVMNSQRRASEGRA
ncbi:MAG: hypothetical protein JSS02_23890 [Planctomycetes bacterium]|nr:hypothetical protein [Planctomycetota bacterium]